MNKAEFNKLTKPQQAVLIAKDVIAQLKTKTYKSKPGTYVSISAEQLNGKGNEELCNLVDGLKDCEVCARGAMFLSQVKFADQYKVKNLVASGYDKSVGVGHNTIEKRLNPVFSRLQQALIETAYEKQPMGLYTALGEDTLYPAVAKACIRFGRKYRNSTKRMIAIMRNIIKNKGRFIPNG